MSDKKEFRLVRLAFSALLEPHHGQAAALTTLGIFIARQDQSDIGCHGYFVAHIVPDGLVKR